MIDVSALFDWLLDGGPGATTAIEIADRLGSELVAAGIRLERLGVFVTTLHPSVLGRAYVWERGKPTRIVLLTAPVHDSPEHQSSPIARCVRTNEAWRWRAGEDDLGSAVLRELAAAGCVDYLALPIRFVNGDTQVLTVASSTAFTDDDIGALRQILRPLARLAEIYAMRRTATNILNTYVGTGSGERVLAGRIRKGDVETIRCALWFSDLRGFTEMSSRITTHETIAVLNDVFECQVPAIEQHGGEVLKFIGDGLLAIFPITDAAPPRDRCAAALAAAANALAALDALNARNHSALRIGLALHIGEVAYGNVGGSSRLDFTAIGSAVNTAARLEGVASKLGRAMVVSADFAALAPRPFEDLGAFELKGIGSQHVFG